MDIQEGVTHLAHLKNANHRTARRYLSEHHPDLMKVEDPGRIEYHGLEAEMWIHREIPTIVVAAVYNGPHLDIYRTQVAEFMANSSYEANPEG